MMRKTGFFGLTRKDPKGEARGAGIGLTSLRQIPGFDYAFELGYALGF